VKRSKFFWGLCALAATPLAVLKRKTTKRWVCVNCKEPIGVDEAPHNGFMYLTAPNGDSMTLLPGNPVEGSPVPGCPCGCNLAMTVWA